MARPAARRRTTAPSRKKRTSGTSRGLRCPDCDFVAKHPMGLGRHRSSRHGVVSQRQARREAEGGWITRKEAARRAGVHYNTIRHWEKTGRLRTSRRGGRSGSLVSATDLARVEGRSGATDGADAARLQALERRFDELLTGLERLVSSARSPARRGGARK
ncbi:MAG: MerR family DNA-binding transcriptional regulator [Actinomycetota bacterium]